MRTVLDAPVEKVGGDVFNVGRSGENYRKLDLVEEIGRQTDTRQRHLRQEATRTRATTRSASTRSARLGFETLMTVPDGIAEVADALDDGAFPDPFDRGYRNIP